MEPDRDAYFEEIITDGGLFRSLKLFKDPSGGYALCGSAEKSLYVYSLPENIFVPNRPNPTYEVLEAESDVVDIFQHNGELLVVDSTGSFYLLLQAGSAAEGLSHFEETDIFDDSVKEDLKWRLEKKYSIPDTKLLAATLVSNGVAVLTHSKDNLQLKVFQMMPFIEMNTFTVKEMRAEAGLLLSVQGRDIEAEYLKDWFCIMDSEEHKSIADVIFICCDGLVFLLPLSEQQPFVAVCIYETIQGVVNMFWSKDGLANNKSALQLVLSVGAVIKIHPFGEEIRHLPLSQIVGVHVDQNVVVASNCHQCYKVEFNPQPDCIKFPHKGLVAFCQIPGHPSTILASTCHRSVYKIDITARKEGKSMFTFPEEKQIRDLNQMVDCLDELSAQIQREEDFHQSLSLVMRGPLLAQRISLSARVVQILGSKHNLRVKINVNIPGVVFLKSSWRVAVLLKTKYSTWTETLSLFHNVSQENPFFELVKFDILKFEEEMKLKCRFICCDSSEKHFFCTPCGDFDLDASFFMLPLSSVPANDAKSLAEHSIAFDGSEGQNICTLEIQLSLISESVDSIFAKILSNSKALWRIADWKEAVEGKQVKFIIFGTLVKMEIKDDVLEIKSSNVELCHCVKISVVKILKLKNDLSFNPSLLSSVESIHHSLEVLQLDPNMEKLIELYQMLRTNTSKLVL